MLVNADRRRALAIAALLLTVVVVGVASAQEANETEADLADKEDAGSVVLLLGLVCALPLLLLALFGILWTVAYPVMLIWAILFSSKKLDQQIADTTSREASLRDSLGRDPLTTIDGGYRTDITSCGIVWTGVVFGPSHWHLLIGFLNNMIGGSIDIFQKVVSAGRAEAMQRLRESAIDNGWDDVINVRIDTSDMAPQGGQGGIKAVEVFAYGTGVKYG
tara:strand:- start:138 stop:794 length:657 start_codon:yes stop_codon:yes gene_type:complete